VVDLGLPAALAARVRATAAAERSTPFMVWLAALAVLIERMSETSDIVLGTVLAGRGDGVPHEVAGFLANIAALRVRLPADPTWRQVLRQARDAALSAFDCADVPFRRLVERLNPERKPASHPVFQALLTPVQPLDPPVTTGGVTFSSAELLSRRSLYELEFQLCDGPYSTTVRLRYQTRFMDRPAAEAVMALLVRLIGDLTDRLDASVAARDLVTDAERRQVLGPAGSGRGDSPGPGPVPAPGRRAGLASNLPATPSQQRVRAVWQRVLELRAIGLDENFFTIGGHSLTAVRAAAELADDFGIAVTAKLLFDHPTIAATAAALDALAATAEGNGTPIRAVRRGRQSLAGLLSDSVTASPEGVSHHA
jgi:non-ribosomal peptide synthetase component F